MLTLEKIENAIEEWGDTKVIEEYILTHDKFVDSKILKVLVYLDKEMKKEALELAQMGEKVF